MTLLLATIVVFAVVEVLPGDPALVMLGTDARPDTMAALRAKYGFDKPLLTRYLAWIGAAVTLLSMLLARRERVVEALLATRQRLVVEALAAEDRERKRLSEDLHDGPLQTLLAARHDLEDVVSPGEQGAGVAMLELEGVR